MRELFLCLGVFALCLAGCEAKPDKPLNRMTSVELEEIVRKGGPNAEDAMFRLSSSYLNYGTPEQAVRAAQMMLSLADKGNRKAKLELCREDYWHIAGEAAMNHCRDAAEMKEGRAYLAFCKINSDPVDQKDMCRLAASFGQAQAFLPHAESLLEDGDRREAYSHFMKALEDGLPRQRDLAVSRLVEFTDIEENPFRPESRRKPDTLYEVLSTPEPRASGFTQKGQCFVKYSVTPTGHPYEVFVDCSHDRLTDEVRATVHDWRFTPAKSGVYPVFMLNQSTTIFFNHN